MDTPIICNGFKDDEFIEMTVLARKIGKQIIPVVEKFTELEAIVRHAEAHKVRPVVGVRVKLAARGAGRWRSGAGYRSKFGLTLTEVLEAVEYLKQRDMADCLQLVHFHLGSQITNIRSIKNALTEAARVYVELHRVGAGVRFLDIGGGLGIDYDGSQTDFESSVNYTLAGVRQRRRLPHQGRLRGSRPCRTRPSSASRAGPSWPTTACSSSTCWARLTSTAIRCRTRCQPTLRSRCRTCTPSTAI